MKIEYELIKHDSNSMYWECRRIETKFCCESLEEENHIGLDRYFFIGEVLDLNIIKMSITYGDDETLIDSIDYCPFCGEKFEYVLKNKYMQVNTKVQVMKEVEEMKTELVKIE
jgi:hypothetical protein